MMDEQFNDPLKQLDAELDVRPSPEFAAKVRMRTSQAAVGQRPLGWILAAAAVIAVISTAPLLIRTWRPASAGLPPSPETVAVAIPHSATPVVSPSTVRDVRRAKPVATTRAKPARPVQRVEQEVIVSQALLEGLAQLRARILDGTLTADLIPESRSDEVGLLPAPGDPRPDQAPRPLDEGIRFGESVRYSG